MPARVFWFMVRQAYRVRAAEDLRRYRLGITLAGMAPDKEMVDGAYKSLVDEVGMVQEVVGGSLVEEPEDVDGKAWLKSIAS